MSYGIFPIRNIAIGIVLSTLLLGIIIPQAVYTQQIWNQMDVSLEGMELTNSPFANLSSGNVKSEFYPDAYTMNSTRPLIIQEDFSMFDTSMMIGFNEALLIAEDWLANVGPPFVVWTLLVYSNSTSPPSWEFQFNHPDFTAFVIVDALSGRVIEYESRYLHDYDPTVLTLSEAEELSLTFLEEYNYTIPASARYIEGEPYDCHRFYSLIFAEYVGQIKVETSEVRIRASAFTRGISYFKYDWIGIDTLELYGTLSPESVKENLGYQIATGLDGQPYYSSLSNIMWEDTVLSLTEINIGAGRQEETLRLAWILPMEANTTTGDIQAEFHIDAFSGNVFASRDSISGYRIIDERPTLLSTEMLLGVSISSAVLLTVVLVYIIFRRLTHRHENSHGLLHE